MQLDARETLILAIAVLFLAMSLMSLQLWTLVDLSMPLILVLLFQVVLIVFRMLGKSYEAAVMASGFAGLSLGVTPTAIANMTAVTKKFGVSHKAFIVVPLIGAFFIDIVNAIVINGFITFLN